MGQHTIVDSSGNRLAVQIKEDDWSDGLKFYSQDDDYVQVGTWVYGAGKSLKAHTHNIVDRTSNRTQEVIFVKKGRLLSEIYDEDSNLVESIELSTGDCLVLLAGGHGYKVLDDDTQVLEIKNGPYAGAEIDRTRLS